MNLRSNSRRLCIRLLTAIGLLAFVSGCAISTPFKGPGYSRKDGVTLENADNVMVGMSYVLLKDDSDARAAFWEEMSNVRAVMFSMDGLVGYSVRRELFGDQGWTVSVWRDEPSMEAFVRSPEHVRAVRRGFAALADARFARVVVPAEDIPLSWERIEALLEEQGAGYEKTPDYESDSSYDQ